MAKKGKSPREESLLEAHEAREERGGADARPGQGGARDRPGARQVALDGRQRGGQAPLRHRAQVDVRGARPRRPLRGLRAASSRGPGAATAASAGAATGAT